MIQTIFTFLFIELLFVTYGDVKYRKIKNIWSLLNIAISVLFFIFMPKLYPLSLESFHFTIVFILVGFLLFLLKIMGGGDSKFLASFFLLVPLSYQEEFFYYLLLSTVVFGSGFFFNNLIKNRKVIFESLRDNNVQGVKNCFGSKFAYAPVILVAWIYLIYKNLLS